MFSVFALFYGPHPELADRCLEGLERSLRGVPGVVADFRLGCNALTDESRRIVTGFAERQQVPCRLYEPCDGRNVGKYTLMRRMLAEPAASRMMWFDDDSHLDPGVGGDWWREALRQASECVLMGCPHVMQQRGRQHLGIVRQPWYGGRQVSESHRFQFVTGGWWCADPRFLQRWDYPFPVLDHNGGDTILGELLRQQGLRLREFPLACCHCDKCVKNRRQRGRSEPRGRVHVNDQGGRSGRRGTGRSGERYPWQRFDPAVPDDYAHHDYRSLVHIYGAT